MKKGLYANINAKKERIAAGSGEKMRKVGERAPRLQKISKIAPKQPKKVSDQDGQDTHVENAEAKG